MYFITKMYCLIGTKKQSIYPVILSCSVSNDAKKKKPLLRVAASFSVRRISLYLSFMAQIKLIEIDRFLAIFETDMRIKYG